MKVLLLTTVAAAAIAIVSGTSARPASAGCHLVDCVEDTYVSPAELRRSSCETLWTLRNSIYKDAGYCFQTDRARSVFGNQGCKFEAMESVSLNDYQRHNVRVLKAAEERKSCT